MPTGEFLTATAELQDLPVEQTIFEMDQRGGDGLDIRLYWNKEDNTTFVLVDDARTGDYFRVDTPEGTTAAEVFSHPMTHARVELERPQ